MSGRRGIYYWKCDRPAAFHGTGEKRDEADVEALLLAELHRQRPGQRITLRPHASQGNHLTWHLELNDAKLFVRVENGPEHDDYFEAELKVLMEVRALGLPVPKVHAVDARRVMVPFAWQVLDRIDCPDLNHWHNLGRLNLGDAAEKIGAAVARWQEIQPDGFGPFDTEALSYKQRLIGLHPSYSDYFLLNLDRHLTFLHDRGFLAATEVADITGEIDRQQALLALPHGCLVHKDLALWNILGTETEIAAYIDWDDAISGDPMDDLSLLGCFYDGATLGRAVAGYTSVRALPDEYRRRFWLHLLRNMIVKAVIRVGAGYFDRGDGFFLIGAGSSGADLRDFTRRRLARALEGLRGNDDIHHL
jgi:aminoglycoside phosphotransferase (APT) family kinase protein